MTAVSAATSFEGAVEIGRMALNDEVRPDN